MLRIALFLLLSLLPLTVFPIEQDTLVTDTRTAGAPRYALPGLLIAYGFAAIEYDALESPDKQLQHEIAENYPNFSTTAEDKLQYLPIVAVYSLDLLGVKSKSDFLDRTGILLISNTMTSISVDFLKDKTHRLRPSGSDHRSFPSGHSANAFAAAEFMRREYQDTSPWYAYAGYTVAVTTGALRLMNNDHWFSDVVAGAGVGILSVNLAYISYPWLKKRIFRDQEPAFLLLPAFRDQRPGYVLYVPLGNKRSGSPVKIPPAPSSTGARQ